MEVTTTGEGRKMNQEIIGLVGVLGIGVILVGIQYLTREIDK